MATLLKESYIHRVLVSLVEGKIPDLLALANGTVTTNLASEISARSSEVNRLDDRTDNLQSLGRYLSTWNVTTGKPSTYPAIPEGAEYPYTYSYKAGDYFIITNIPESGTKYKPDGKNITKQSETAEWAIGTAEETDTVKENDYYIFDSTNWHLIINTQRTVTFNSLAGSARSNLALKVELEKVDAIYYQPSTEASATGLLVDEITARVSDVSSVRTALSNHISDKKIHIM